MRHRGSWWLKQPPRLPRTHHRDEAFALQAAFGIINAPADLKSLSSLLLLRLVSHMLHQTCLVQLLNQTQLSWPCLAHIRTHTRTHGPSYIHTHNTCALSRLCGNSPGLLIRGSLWRVLRVCFHLNLKLVSGTHNSWVVISWITCTQRFIVVTVMWWPPVKRN